VWEEKPRPIKINYRALIHVQGLSVSFLGSGMAAANAVSLGLPLKSFETDFSGSFATDL